MNQPALREAVVSRPDQRSDWLALDKDAEVFRIAASAIRTGRSVEWDAATLPFMGQWKLMQAGEYVCALEPANYWETPRATLREQGRLKLLGAGESVNYELELGTIV